VDLVSGGGVMLDVHVDAAVADGALGATTVSATIWAAASL
jgi:hypothetical protein